MFFFFYLSLSLKRKLHIKVIEAISLIVFSFVYPGVSPLLFIYFILFHSFYHLFYFILLLQILNFFSSSLFFIFNFPRGWHDCFAVCRSLFSPFIFLSSFLLFLPSNPSSSYTYPNSILRLTQLFDSLPVPQYLFCLFFNLYILFNPILIRISVIITFC